MVKDHYLFCDFSFDSEGHDQSMQMHMLIWAYTVCICSMNIFLTTLLISILILFFLTKAL